MVLESTVVCVDNSEYMRNGDFLPSRLHAQQDAVNLVCQSKTRSNPENNVGLITLSDDTEVLVTLTTDVAKVLSKLHQTTPNGDINFLCGIKVAHLVLKHRQGKNHKMRIIIFVGSPIEDAEKELIKYGKRLRKEKVNVDVVNFGEESANTEKLTTFISTINGADTVSGSHLVTVPPGPLLSDTLITSPIFMGEDGVSNVGGGGSFEFGIDPNEDPELALALRVSMEEQRAQQEARRGGQSSQPAIQEESNEEVMLKQALEMSVDEVATNSTAATTAPVATKVPATSDKLAATTPTTATHNLASMTEEQQMAYALQMSMEVQDEEGTSTIKEEKMDEEEEEDLIQDPQFLRSVLQTLPGVDADSDAVKNAMDEMKKKNEDEKKK